jgi:hypothetical protein
MRGSQWASAADFGLTSASALRAAKKAFARIPLAFAPTNAIEPRAADDECSNLIVGDIVALVTRT